MKTVLLSFDIEEFDMPLEYGRQIPFEEQIDISARGTAIILDILKHHGIRSTFFSTVVFASNAENLIKRIIRDGHELASHGYFHSNFQHRHVSESKSALEKISSTCVEGFRMPRMMPVNDDALCQAGYRYDSSINPTFIPGRYNNLSKPRIMFRGDSLIHIPASVTPLIRFPLFWLSFHNFPLWLYQSMCKYTMLNDCYLNIYFHPWEFIDIDSARFGLPKFVCRNSGRKMEGRFVNWITWLKSQGYVFTTMAKFVQARMSESR